VLEVRGVCKRFGDVIAMDEVSLSVPRGGIVGFLGPNGAGKSTTMRSIMGLISTDAGQITWDGLPIDASTRRRFGYMPAERGMYPKMTVRDEVVYFARLAGLSKRDALAAAEAWMERLGIEARAGDEVQALSSGNQQRVQLAIALVHDPVLLVLDEPFSGLDPVAVETMKDVLAQQLAQGTSVLFSSHQLDLVTDVSRDVVIIDNGQVVLQGDVHDIRQRATEREAFVAFATDTVWEPVTDGADGVEIVEIVDRHPRSVRLRVPATQEPSALLASAGRAGQVVEFSFAPPDLSEVFLATVGGAHGRAGVVG